MDAVGIWAEDETITFSSTSRVQCETRARLLGIGRKTGSVTRRHPAARPRSPQILPDNRGILHTRALCSESGRRQPRRRRPSLGRAEGMMKGGVRSPHYVRERTSRVHPQERDALRGGVRSSVGLELRGQPVSVVEGVFDAKRLGWRSLAVSDTGTSSIVPGSLGSISEPPNHRGSDRTGTITTLTAKARGTRSSSRVSHADGQAAGDDNLGRTGIGHLDVRWERDTLIADVQHQQRGRRNCLPCGRRTAGLDFRQTPSPGCQQPVLEACGSHGGRHAADESNCHSSPVR